MFVEQMVFNRPDMRIELQRLQSHFGDNLQSECRFNCAGAAGSPRKGSVPIDKDSRNFRRVQVFKSLDDYVPSLPLIRGPDLLRSQRPCDRHFSIKIIRVSGAEAWDASSGLS